MGSLNRNKEVKNKRKVTWLWKWPKLQEWEYRYPIIKVTSRSGENYVKVSFVRDWWNLWNLDYRVRVTFLGVEIETYDKDRIK